jgi:hypothetical protein
MLNSASKPRRAKPEDIYALPQLFVAAFRGDPIINWIARSGPKRALALEQFFFWLLHERAIPAGEVWMSDDGATCAAWLPPDARMQPGGFFGQLRLLPRYTCGFSGFHG